MLCVAPSSLSHSEPMRPCLGYRNQFCAGQTRKLDCEKTLRASAKYRHATQDAGKILLKSMNGCRQCFY